jgi:hypothetical protein
MGGYRRGMSFGEHLVSEGPWQPLASQLMTFGRFVGSWDLRWSRPGDEAAPADVSGELHLGWTLGGRAVQDVWIVPGTDSGNAGAGPHAFWGSTIRFYDQDLGAWRSTWVEPVSGRVRRFIGRPVAGEIHLISTDDAPFLRWRFTEITDDRFVWLGEYSVDEGRSWQLEERMVATRRGGHGRTGPPRPTEGTHHHE